MPLFSNPIFGLTHAEVEKRLTVCREVLLSAGELAIDGFQRIGMDGGVTMKGPQDYLTEYDRLVEDHIRSRLGRAFPEDGFLGEESTARIAPRLWVVDPIDGTANFARGIPHFAISIAFMDQGTVLFGGISNPAVNETYIAVRGCGAERNDHAISTAATTRMDCASVELGWSPRVANEVYLNRCAALLDTGANVRRAASGALGLAYVADGRSDAYVELHINAWDCLAGLLLVCEAGGRVNDFLRNDGLENGNPIIAAAPGIATIVSRAAGIPLAELTRN